MGAVYVAEQLSTARSCVKVLDFGIARMIAEAQTTSSRTTTCPVGSFTTGQTPEGVLDMAGNVAEWVDGWHCPYDPARGCVQDRHTARGGGRASTDSSEVKATSRPAKTIPHVSTSIGFRCAADYSSLK